MYVSGMTLVSLGIQCIISTQYNVFNDYYNICYFILWGLMFLLLYKLMIWMAKKCKLWQLEDDWKIEDK